MDSTEIRLTMFLHPVRNVKTYPGADCGSDHELLMAKIKIKLKKLKKEPPPLRYDLKEINSINNYSIDIRSKFNEERTPSELWSQIKDNIHEAAKKNIPLAKRKKSQWISNNTLDLIDMKRKAKKTNMEEYKHLQKRVRAACREDKQNFVTRQSEWMVNLMHNTEHQKCTQKSGK